MTMLRIVHQLIQQSITSNLQRSIKENKMKLISSIVFASLTILIVVYSLQTKNKHDKLRATLGAPLKVVTISSKTEKLLNEVKANWVEQYNKIDSPDSEAIQLANLKPSVNNWIDIVTYQLPKYSFLSPNKNKKSVKIAMIRNLICPITIDNSIHISKDRQLALIRVKKKFSFSAIRRRTRLTLH